MTAKCFEFRVWLKSTRKTRGWSQEELGKRCLPPLSRTRIFNLENGRRQPTDGEVAAIMRAMDEKA